MHYPESFHWWYGDLQLSSAPPQLPAHPWGRWAKAPGVFWVKSVTVKMCDSEQGKHTPNSALHVLHLSFCFPNSSLMNIFFPFNEHPFFLKPHWHCSLYAVVSCLLQWTSCCPCFLCSIVSLTSLLGGPLNGYDIMVVYPSDCCWCMIISFFISQMTSQLMALHDQLLQPFQVLPYI